MDKYEVKSNNHKSLLFLSTKLPFFVHLYTEIPTLDYFLLH